VPSGHEAFGISKGWGAGASQRAANAATKGRLRAVKPPKSDARQEHYGRAWRKFTNLQERSNAGQKISPMRSRAFAPLERDLPEYGGRTGSNWEFNGNKRVRKSFLPKPATSFARGGRARSGYLKAVNLTSAERDTLRTNISRRKRMRGVGMSTKLKGV